MSRNNNNTKMQLALFESRLERLDARIANGPSADLASQKAALLVELMAFCRDNGVDDISEVAETEFYDLGRAWPDQAQAALNAANASDVRSGSASPSNRNMNTRPSTTDQVNDTQARKKYGQFITKFDECQVMTTPEDATWPRITSFVVTVNECLPNKGGGDRTTMTSPGEKRRTDGPQVAVRAFPGSVDDPDVARDAFLAVAKKLNDAPSIDQVGYLRREDAVRINNSREKHHVSFSFDKESYLTRLFSADNSANQVATPMARTDLFSDFGQAARRNQDDGNGAFGDLNSAAGRRRSSPHGGFNDLGEALRRRRGNDGARNDFGIGGGSTVTPPRPQQNGAFPAARAMQSPLPEWRSPTQQGTGYIGGVTGATGWCPFGRNCPQYPNCALNHP